MRKVLVVRTNVVHIVNELWTDYAVTADTECHMRHMVLHRSSRVFDGVRAMTEHKDTLALPWHIDDVCHDAATDAANELVFPGHVELSRRSKPAAGVQKHPFAGHVHALLKGFALQIAQALALTLALTLAHPANFHSREDVLCEVALFQRQQAVVQQLMAVAVVRVR
jgi:hypothetical protein